MDPIILLLIASILFVLLLTFTLIVIRNKKDWLISVFSLQITAVGICLILKYDDLLPLLLGYLFIAYGIILTLSLFFRTEKK